MLRVANRSARRVAAAGRVRGFVDVNSERIDRCVTRIVEQHTAARREHVTQHLDALAQGTIEHYELPQTYPVTERYYLHAATLQRGLDVSEHSTRETLVVTRPTVAVAPTPRTSQQRPSTRWTTQAPPAADAADTEAETVVADV